MLNEKEKKDIQARLKRIEGQVRGIGNMIHEERYCIDILTQFRAIAAAIGKVEDIIMNSHLHTCVVESMQKGNDTDKEAKINEIMTILAKYRK